MKTIAADWIKARRTWMAPFAVFGPVGVIALVVVNWAMRAEWLHAAVPESGAWFVVMNDTGLIEVAAITLGVALLVSMVFDVDHRSHAWKQLFALPISRVGVYLAKLLVALVLLLVASALVVLGVIGIWQWQGLGPLPWRHLGELFVAPWLAVLPLIAIQGVLSAHIRNQAAAITVGVAGVVFGMFGSDLPTWLPWASPVYAMKWVVTGDGDIVRLLGVGAAWALVIALAGAFAFARRDVV